MQSTVCPDTQSDKNKIVLIISFNMLRRAVCDLLIEKEKRFFNSCGRKTKNPSGAEGPAATDCHAYRSHPEKVGLPSCKQDDGLINLVEHVRFHNVVFQKLMWQM